MKKLLVVCTAILFISFNIQVLAQTGAEKDENSNKINWSEVEPVSTSTESNVPVQFRITDTFLITSDISRRDPSDVIYYKGKYYVWYTKIPKGNPGYPHGWTGTVWYATSVDGKQWKEEGMALDAGKTESWDGAGVYTPNILMYKEKFYLAYTAMAYPFSREFSQASIGMAVSDSPDGPWKKLLDNPIIQPGKCLQLADGFLTDDAVFVVKGDKIWLFIKAIPVGKIVRSESIRAINNTFLMAAKADTPEGPYTKHPLPLHRGHEVLVWKEYTGIGSFALNLGKYIYYHATNGLSFQPLHPLALNKDNFQIKAAGLYREDFEENKKLKKPEWGICMDKETQGLARFEIIWP